TPRSLRPYEHAAVAYRLGLAYAESPVGSRGELLRKALACFDVAAAIFDPRFDPVEHARVLNAAGACHRALGDRRKAVELFEKAADLLEGRERDDERAAALNNLGLARTELGQPEAAVEAFDVAAELFDTGTPDGRRGRVATLHNRGQAHAAMGTAEGVEAALADYDEAQDDLDADEAPYHYGLVHHSIGAAVSALAALRPDERDRLLREAVEAFSASLTVFTRFAFPYQHALAKHNLGLAYAGIADVLAQQPGRGGKSRLQYLRRALASFEDGVAMLDTRLHSDAWKQAYASLSRAEQELAPDAGGASRAEHFTALLAGTDEDERAALLRERLARLLALPDPGRARALAELATASLRWGRDSAQLIMEAELAFLMEQPTELLEVALRARFAAHQQLPDDEREEADRALDDAIGAALGAPQRVFVRDFLYSIGWERP
ncbi:MAG: tetratricopeptide repeat protein, partial [Actinomycetota bacterium]|nr:tetratricopeptide repeat protein [Actinomycetota bacterium]